MKYLVAVYEVTNPPLHKGLTAVRLYESGDVLTPEDAVTEWAGKQAEIEAS